MKKNHYLILGGIILIGGYLWYKNDKDKKARKALTTTAVTSEPMKEGEASNIGGTCTCDNGFTGYCAGDCNRCCGRMNKKKRPTETRTFNF